MLEVPPKAGGWAGSVQGRHGSPSRPRGPSLRPAVCFAVCFAAPYTASSAVDAGAPAITSALQPAGRRERQGGGLSSLCSREVRVQLCLNLLNRKALSWPHPDTGDGKCSPHSGQLGVEGWGACAGASISSCYGAPGSRCLSQRGLGGSHVDPLVVDFSTSDSALWSRRPSCLAGGWSPWALGSA